MHFQLENIAANTTNFYITKKHVDNFKNYHRKILLETGTERVLFLDFTEQIIYEIAFTRRAVYKGHAKAHWEWHTKKLKREKFQAQHANRKHTSPSICTMERWLTTQKLKLTDIVRLPCCQGTGIHSTSSGREGGSLTSLQQVDSSG